MNPNLTTVNLENIASGRTQYIENGELKSTRSIFGDAWLYTKFTAKSLLRLISKDISPPSLIINKTFVHLKFLEAAATQTEQLGKKTAIYINQIAQNELRRDHVYSPVVVFCPIKS